VGYQYKFYPSPLSSEHRAEIKAAIVKAQNARQGEKQRRRLTKWVLVTPDDLTESGRREGGGDVTWFDRLQHDLHCKFALEHWGHRKLQALFLDTPALCLFYYPGLVPEGAARRRTIEPRVTDPRWHEVIRLLVAGMRSGDSQALLVDRLLNLQAAGNGTHVALLLGGLLLDGIEAAELESVAVAERLIRVCVSETEPEWVSRLVSQIRCLDRRAPNQGACLSEGFRRVWRNSNDTERNACLLIGFAVVIDTSRLADLTDHAVISEGFGWQSMLLACEPADEWPEEVTRRFRKFYTALAFYAARGPWSNELAMLAESAVPRGILEKRAFSLRLFLIAECADRVAPFMHFGRLSMPLVAVRLSVVPPLMTYHSLETIQSELADSLASDEYRAIKRGRGLGKAISSIFSSRDNALAKTASLRSRKCLARGFPFLSKG
jgi:hypothetical protein